MKKATNKSKPRSVKRKKKVAKSHKSPDHLQWRFWCPVAATYVMDYTYSGLVDELFNPEDNMLLPQQCTGLTDRDGRLVFEGDKVELSKGIIGDVIRNPIEPSNLILMTTSGMQLGVRLVTHGKVLGSTPPTPNP